MEHPGLGQGVANEPRISASPRQYGEWQIFNSDAAEIPPNALAQVTENCRYDGTAGAAYHKVVKPTVDSAPSALVVPFGCPAGAPGLATMDDRFAGVVIQYEGAAPTVGGTLGTAAGSWYGKAGNSGFIVMAVDTVAELAFCRAASTGGGGSFSVVQATADGAAGVIATKAMTMKATPASSPNYTLADDAVNLNYFKL